jgi:aryl-alcohol dehydrogenase-like predicted oxidoreductase
MQTVRLGRNGPLVSAFGLGCMGMSGGYGPADDKESIATIHAALEAGVTMIDTGDFYGMGHNEMLIRDAVKCGAMRGPDMKFIGDDARPNAIKNFLAYSLKRLGTDYIDLYQPSRVDPAVPIEDSIGAIADTVTAGYVRHVGVSEASSKTVRRAHATHPIAALQIEYSLFTRNIEKETLPTLRELGIGLVAYGVLAGGLISDRAEASKNAASEIRSRKPRFHDENFAKNIALVTALGEIAREKGVTTQQLAFAWVKSRGDDIVPLIGARRRDQLREALGTVELKLTSADLARIERAVPNGAVAGTRYLPAILARMDSEI